MAQIEFKQGDIFNNKSEAIVNPVNCVGVMGKGLALQFKHQFPHNFILYADACRKGNVTIGKMFITKNPTDELKYIVNFPTKAHWRNPSQLQFIEDGLEDLYKEIINNNIKSIAIPPLGCGLGGLPWKSVRNLIITKLEKLPDDVIITIYGKGT